MPITIVRKMEDAEWVKRLGELHEYADRRRMAAWTRWNESWRIYNNQYDFSHKADWQAQTYIAKLGIMIEMAASLVRRAMLDAGDEFFRFYGKTTTSRKMAPFLEKMVYYYLKELRFADNFVPPLKGGLVGSLIVVKPFLAPYTMVPLDDEDQEKAAAGELLEREIVEGPAIQVAYPDPYDIWLDPRGRGLFVMERERMDLAAVMDLVDMEVFDGDQAKKLAAEDADEDDDEIYRDRRRQQSSDTGEPMFRKEVELLHFWGSMPNEDGKWAIRNGHFVVANEKYLLRKPIENPYEHRKIPYIIGSPFRRPFSVYHKGLAEDVVGVAKAMTELVDLTLDATLFAAIKAFEVDLDQIEDPQQILSGIYPGKVFTKRGGGQNQPMVRDIEISGVSRETVGVYNLLNTEFQNATAVTEFISGALGSGAGRTATEVVTKQQQGMGIFGEMARNLEGTVIEPTMEMLGSLVVEHHEDFTDPDMIEILGPDLATEMMNLAIEERVAHFEPSKMRVEAKGITALLSRTEEIQRIMVLLQGIGQFGQALPMIFQDVDAPYFFKGIFQKLVRAFGWNEADFIRTPPAPVIPAGGAAAPGAGATPPGPAPQSGQAAPPPNAQVEGQIAKIQQIIGGGNIAPSPMGGQ